MKQRRRYWLEVMAGYCLAILAGFVFISEQTCELTNTQKEQQYLTEDPGGIPQGHLIIENQPLHVPFSPTCAIIEPELKPPHGSNNDGDDDGSKLCWILPLDLALNIHEENSLFFQLQQSLECRRIISRYILYHCWKTFIL